MTVTYAPPAWRVPAARPVPAPAPVRFQPPEPVAADLLARIDAATDLILFFRNTRKTIPARTVEEFLHLVLLTLRTPIAEEST